MFPTYLAMQQIIHYSSRRAVLDLSPVHLRATQVDRLPARELSRPPLSPARRLPLQEIHQESLFRLAPLVSFLRVPPAHRAAHPSAPARELAAAPIPSIPQTAASSPLPFPDSLVLLRDEDSDDSFHLCRALRSRRRRKMSRWDRFSTAEEGRRSRRYRRGRRVGDTVESRGFLSHGNGQR